MEGLEAVIFGIITHAGNARGLAYEALQAAEQGDFAKAQTLMSDAEEDIRQAHKIQTEIIHKEASGERVDVGVLFVHSQDHLMTAISEKTLIERLIVMYQRLTLLEQKG
jgi:PTS system cellobiose-specific IIA component